MTSKTWIFLILVLAVFSSCEQTTPPTTRPQSDKKALVSLVFEARLNPGRLSADATALPLAGDSGTWLAERLPANATLDGLVPSFEVSEGATLLLDGKALLSGRSALSCSRELSLVVKAEDGSESRVLLRVTKLPPETGCRILSLSAFAAAVGDPSAAPVECRAGILPPDIGEEGGTLVLTAPALDFGSARIEAELSRGARFETASGQVIGRETALALEDGEEFHVVAEDGRSSIYRLSLPRSEAASVHAVLLPETRGDPERIEVLVRRKAELETARLVLTSAGALPRVLCTLSALPAWEGLDEGGILRLWPEGSLESGLVTGSVVDAEIEGWEGLDPAAPALLHIEDTGRMVCAFVLGAPDGSWFPDAELAGTSLPLAAALGLWPGQGEACAVHGVPLEVTATDGAMLEAGREIHLVEGRDGRSPDDYGDATVLPTALLRPSLSGSSNAGRSSRLVLEASTACAGDSRILGLSADLSDLGLGPDEALLPSAIGYALEFDTGPDLSAGTRRIAVRGRFDLAGAVLKYSREVTLDVLPPRSLALDGVAISPEEVSTRSATRRVSVSARVSALWGAKVERVTANLSAFGGPSDEALTAGADGAWTLSREVAGEVAAGSHGVLVSAWDDTDGLSAVATVQVRAWPPAFEGADMEAGGPPGMPAKSSLDAGSPYEGGAAFRYSSTVTTNTTVAVSSAKLLPPEGAKRLVFFFRGSSTGSAPGLRFQLGSGGSYKCYYDLNGIREGVALVVAPSSGGTYPVDPVNVAAWTRVELDLAGLVVSGTAGDSLAAYPLQFRVRSGGVSDWEIDFVHFE